MKISFSPPDISEEEINEVIDTLRSGWITTGSKTKKFEEKIAEYCGVQKGVCLSSATAGLELTLRLFDIGPGDEVITTAFTYTATASVISHVGAKIVFIDTDVDTYEMDYNQLEKAINKNTKAIIPVDYAGVMCDYAKILEIAESRKSIFKPDNSLQEALGRILVLSDSAHSFGSKRDGIVSGAYADFSVFSFHAVKNLTTAEGGGVVWKTIKSVDSDDIYKKYMLLSLQGQTKDALAKSQANSWEYDIIAPYYKCNMTDIQASIGLVQLKRYPWILNRRKEIVHIYDKLLSFHNVQILKHEGENFESCRHLFVLRLNGRDESYRNNLIYKLSDYGIPANVHYKPLPMFTAYKNMGFKIQDYPNAFNFYQNLITLPLHTNLKDVEAEYISDTIIRILNNK